MSAEQLMQECHGALSSPNMQAFLRVIRAGETSQGDEAYRMIVGGGLFESFDDHPRKLVHIASLGVNSTAAGAYQFLSRTWDGCAKALELPDFSPAMQDIAAVYLIRGRGALQDVIAGRLDVAIAKCAREWASLPGSPYGQPTRSMAQAKATYEQYGGAYAQTSEEEPPRHIPPPQTAPPTARMPAGEAPDWPFPQPENVTMPIPGLIGVLAGTLIEAFAPLAREKITREIGRHTDNAAVSGQVANAVIEAVKTATGKADPIAAVAAAQNDPVVMQAAETSALDTIDRLAPMLDKMAQWEQQAWTAEESSRADARKHNDADPLMIDFPWLKLKFIHILSLVLVSFSGWFVTANWGSLTPELKGAVITLMVIAGWNGVKDYWMGSSRSSGAKDVVIGELARRPKGAP